MPRSDGLNSYPVLDSLTGVTQGAESRTFVYDSLKRLTRAVNPETNSVTYGYDTIGNLTSRADGRGYTTTFVYDALNRLTSKSYSVNANTPNVTYTWDTVQPGQLSSVATASVTRSYGAYDALGRPLASTQTVSGTTAGGVTCVFGYTYNRSGGLLVYTLPSGRTITYTPDAAGRVGTVTSGSTTYASLLSGPDTANSGVQMPGYASSGAMQRLALGNGLIERTGFNKRMQPVAIQLGVVGNPASISGLGVSWCGSLTTTDCSNNNGSLQWASIAPANVTQSFTYDTLDRLSTAAEAGTWSQAYDYDRYGNRWVIPAGTTGLPTNGLEPTSQSWYTAATNQFTDTQNYDAAGNRTFLSPYTLSYDAENRVAGAASASNGSTIYTYDGDGRRVLAAFSSGTYTLYVNDAEGRLAAEYSTNAPSNAGTQYVSVDWLGSTRVTTDGSGGGVQRFDYLPFGLELGSLGLASRPSGLGYGNAGPRLKFTGKPRDGETGLDYFGARYFSGAQGRFTSTDPATGSPSDPQSWNAYAYARNNPLLYTDPDGQTYRICDTNGNCEDSYSDANFDKNLSRTSKNGVVYDKDGAKIGTYQRTSFDDLGPLGNSLYMGMAARREASNQFIGAFAVGSAAVGTGGALAVNAAGLTAGAGLTTVNLQGAAQAAALSLPAGAKLGQMIARSGNASFIGNPQGFLSFAREFVETAVKQGTYAAGDYISKAGSTIYRVGNDFLTVSREGKILSYVQGANAGGVAARYSQLGGKEALRVAWRRHSPWLSL